MTKIGRPPTFDNPQDLQDKIDDYFENNKRIRKVLVKTKTGHCFVEMPVFTITGLVLHCGFESRQSFYAYEKKENFSYTIKTARTRIEQEYEDILQTIGGSAAIFALKNFGWIDRSAIGHFIEDDPAARDAFFSTNGHLGTNGTNGKSKNGKVKPSRM